MTKKSFIYYIQTIFRIHDIPMRIFNDGKLLDRYEFSPFPLPDFDRIMQEHLASINENVYIYQTGNLFLYGAIKDKKKKLFVAIGPVQAILPEDITVEQIARFIGMPIAEMTAYLDELPVIPSRKFSRIVSEMYTAINNEIVTSDELYQKIVKWKSDTGVTQTVLNHEEALTFDELPHLNSYEIEQKLLYYVRNGMVNELKEYWLNIVPENLFTITNDRSVRNAKNHCILGLALIADTAIKAGLPPESVIKMRELYMKETEQCKSLQQVMQLRCTILCDFSERTRRIRFKKPASPLIDRAVSYILKNIANEITLGKVADYLKTGTTYLSTKFKEEMGVSFTDFVNIQKVEKSKELLLFTDKSIAEIAAYLSFSSQGYFQIIFKKYTGTTPNAFRNNKTAGTPVS